MKRIFTRSLIPGITSTDVIKSAAALVAHSIQENRILNEDGATPDPAPRNISLATANKYAKELGGVLFKATKK